MNFRSFVCLLKLRLIYPSRFFCCKSNDVIELKVGTGFIMESYSFQNDRVTESFHRIAIKSVCLGQFKVR